MVNTRIPRTDDEKYEMCASYGHPPVDEGVIDRCPCGAVDNRLVEDDDAEDEDGA